MSTTKTKRAARRAMAFPRGVPSLPGPRFTSDQIARQALRLIKAWPDYAHALADPEESAQLRSIALAKLRDRAHDDRRRVRKAQRQARRVNRRRR